MTDAAYFKDDLLLRAKVLQQRRTQRRWPETSQARVEQHLVVGLYGVRKLIAAGEAADPGGALELCGLVLGGSSVALRTDASGGLVGFAVGPREVPVEEVIRVFRTVGGAGG